MSLYQENEIDGQAFEEVNNILEDEPGSQVDALNSKVIQLQKIITTLTRTNERLIQRIEDLEDELEFRNDEDQTNNFNEEYSVMQGNFGDVEELISSYKAELGKYQEKMTAQANLKNETIDRLQGQVDDLNRFNQKLRQRIDDLEDDNQRLSQTKDSLITQIQELESSIRKSKAESPRYSSKYTDYSDYPGRYEGDLAIDFSMNVQAQLEKLIEKLVRELEHERYLKKKLTEEIKQLQKDMLEQEKEIIAKNNKIYALEITALKKVRSSPPGEERYRVSQTNSKETPKGREERGRGGRDKDIVSKARNFTLMELMNECTVLSSQQKLGIALKVIDLYSKKLQRNDFTSEILQSLTICNFNPSTANLCQVKLNPNIEKDQQGEQDLTESSLVWNLIFILDNLLSQTATKDRPFGQTDQEDMLLEAINYYLENRDMNSVDSMLEVRKIVEEALNVEMR